MNRRAFLGTVGIGITTTAGCISQATPGEQPSGQSGPSTDRPTTSEPTGGKQTNEHERVSTGETTEVVLGEETVSEDETRRPHGIVIENPTNEARIGHLVVRRPDDAVALDETYELESEAKVTITLTDPLRYSVEVTIPETGATQTVDVDLAWFDCNASSTSFTIQSDGQVEHSTISTQMACTNVETEHISSGEEISRSLGDGSLSGDGDRKPHGVSIANPTEDTWTTRLLIVNDEETLLDGLYTLESEGTVSITLTEADRYEGTASVPTAGTSATFGVEPEQFDCNHSSTNVTLKSDGQLDVETISTLMACQPSNDGEGETPAQ